jgi:hypothetical protein
MPQCIPLVTTLVVAVAIAKVAATVKVVVLNVTAGMTSSHCKLC